MEEKLVKLRVPLGEEIIRLSALDQQVTRSYTQVLIVFELSQGGDVGDALSQLQQGLGQALCETPDFASIVQPLPGSQRKELELSLGPQSGVPVRVLDCTLSCHNYSELADNNFPMAGMPKDMLRAVNCVDQYLSRNGLPALLVQINLIDGGMIMAMAWHHTVSDARGFNTFLESWSRHTRALISGEIVGVPGTQPESSLERWRLDYGSRNTDISRWPELVINPTVRSPSHPASCHLLDREHQSATDAVFSVWYFSASSLRALGNFLSGSRAAEHEPRFTHSEAVSALIWKHLSLARLLHRCAPNGTSLFTTRVEFRGKTSPPLHDRFIGNIGKPHARVRLPIQQVCAPPSPESLSALALAIQDAVLALGENEMREFIRLVELSPAVTDLAEVYDLFPGPDLAVADLSSMSALRHDWGGVLGHPRCVRNGSLEGRLMHLLPQDRNGGFEVQLHCEREAIVRLQSDGMFTKYAQFRC